MRLEIQKENDDENIIVYKFFYIVLISWFLLASLL